MNNLRLVKALYRRHILPQISLTSFSDFFPTWELSLHCTLVPILMPSLLSSFVVATGNLMMTSFPCCIPPWRFTKVLKHSTPVHSSNSCAFLPLKLDFLSLSASAQQHVYFTSCPQGQQSTCLHSLLLRLKGISSGPRALPTLRPLLHPFMFGSPAR